MDNISKAHPRALGIRLSRAAVVARSWRDPGFTFLLLLLLLLLSLSLLLLRHGRVGVSPWRGWPYWRELQFGSDGLLRSVCAGGHLECTVVLCGSAWEQGNVVGTSAGWVELLDGHLTGVAATIASCPRQWSFRACASRWCLIVGRRRLARGHRGAARDGTLGRWVVGGPQGRRIARTHACRSVHARWARREGHLRSMHVSLSKTRRWQDFSRRNRLSLVLIGK
jgi:hypothetical protein